MVPASYTIFFTTMASAGATLFGLIFVAISIAPEQLTTTTAPVIRQIRATAAYVALLNPLMIALFALVPYQVLGIAVTVLSWVGIINTLAMSVTLLQNIEQEIGRLRNILLILISLVLYGMEAYVGSQLSSLEVNNIIWFSILADLLIIITLFGIVRAWDLIGIRKFRLRDWLAMIGHLKKKLAKNEASEPGADESKE